MPIKNAPRTKKKLEDATATVGSLAPMLKKPINREYDKRIASYKYKKVKRK